MIRLVYHFVICNFYETATMGKFVKTIILPMIILLLILGTKVSANDMATTLYRTSLIIENARMHVATFNADAGEGYNWDNCLIAAKLFQSQPDVKTYFWCEKGEYVK